MENSEFRLNINSLGCVRHFHLYCSYGCITCRARLTKTDYGTLYVGCLIPLSNVLVLVHHANLCYSSFYIISFPFSMNARSLSSFLAKHSQFTSSNADLQIYIDHYTYHNHQIDYGIPDIYNTDRCTKYGDRFSSKSASNVTVEALL